MSQPKRIWVLAVTDQLADLENAADTQRRRAVGRYQALHEDQVAGAAQESFAGAERHIAEKMDDKERLEAQFSQARLSLQRLRGQYGPQPAESLAELENRLQDLRVRLQPLDGEIAPLAKAATELTNSRWGLLTRAGNDKSHLARQVERYADVYTSRVSNFLHASPFVYLRSPRGSLPHDPGSPGGSSLAMAPEAAGPDLPV